MSWADTYRVLSLLFLVLLLAAAVTLAAWAVRTLRRPVRSVDDPSGREVPAADLLPMTVWITNVDRVRPEPWAYRTRHYKASRPIRTGAVCDRTTVDLTPVIEEVTR